MSDFAAILAKLESSCQKFQIQELRKEAEEELSQFQKSPSAFDPALYILQHSQNPSAKFYACRAIVYSIFKEYEKINDIYPYIQALIRHSLECGDLSQFWTRRCLNSAACLIKRAYLDSPDLLWQCLSTLLQNGVVPNVAQMNVGMHLLKSILIVFQDSKISISFEFHYQCQLYFQNNLLHSLLEFLSSKLLNCLQEAQSTPLRLTESSFISFVSTTINCLELLLHWDFSIPTPANPNPSNALEFSPLHFPIEWHPIIVSELFIDMLFTWKSFLPPNLLHSVTQCIFAISNFASAPSPLDYCSRILKGSLKLSDNLHNQFELGQLNLIHGVVHRLVLHFDLPFLFQLSTFSGILVKLSGLALSCVGDHSYSDDFELCKEETVSEIISMWSMIASRALHLNMEHKFDTFSLQQIAQLSNPILHCFVLDKQQYISEDDVELEDETNLKDWDTYSSLLLDLGMLCRLDPNTNASFLLNQLQTCFNALPNTEEKTRVLILEGIHWLLMVTACFLADSSESEFAQIPLSILQCSSPQIIQNCCQSIFQLLNYNFELSPLVMTTVLWAMQRIMPSYVCISKGDYHSVLDESWTQFLNEDFLLSLLPQFHKLLLQWQTELGVLEQLVNIFETCAKLPLQRNVLIHSDTFLILGKSILQFFNFLPEQFGQRFISLLVRVATFKRDHPLLPVLFTSTNELATALSKSNFELNTCLKTIEFFNGIASSITFTNAEIIFQIVLPGLEVLVSKPLESTELFLPLLGFFRRLLGNDILFLDTTILMPIFHFLAHLLNRIQFHSKEDDLIIEFMNLACIFGESQQIDILKVFISKLTQLVTGFSLPIQPHFLDCLIQFNSTLLNDHPFFFPLFEGFFCSSWCHILKNATSEQLGKALCWVPIFSTHRLPHESVIHAILYLVFQISNLEETSLWINACKYLFISHYDTMTLYTRNSDELQEIHLIFKHYREQGGEWEPFERKLFMHVYNLSKCGLTAAVL